MTGNCSYCGKPFRSRYWFCPFSKTQQCDRLICRLQTGHWLRFRFHRKVEWKTLTLKFPVLIKTGFKKGGK